MNTSNPTGESQMQAALRSRLIALRDDATSLAGTAAKMASAINQALDKGGPVHLQPQIAFVTGAHARMNKDIGVIEFLQGQNIVAKKAPPTR